MLSAVAAALVVLIVPLAVSGYRLSRNKLLLFSCLLFISLFIFVHVITPFLSSPLPLPPSPFPFPCLSPHFPSPSSFSFPCPSFSPLSSPSALSLLNGSHIVIAGDSQSRLFTLSLLSLLLNPADLPAAETALSRRHSDYSTSVPAEGISVHFLWSPFESNLTSLLKNLSPPPDLLIAGSGLWHMLHVTNPAHYADQISKIKKLATGVFPSKSHLFWLGMPNLVEGMLNTEEKRMRMNRTVRMEYERGSRLLARDAGGEFFYLDIGLMSRRCGERCTVDGMHYDKVVYDAAVQVVLNVLLIESRQMK